MCHATRHLVSFRGRTAAARPAVSTQLEPGTRSNRMGHPDKEEPAARDSPLGLYYGPTLGLVWRGWACRCAGATLPGREIGASLDTSRSRPTADTDPQRETGSQERGLQGRAARGLASARDPRRWGCTDSKKVAANTHTHTHTHAHAHTRTRIRICTAHGSLHTSVPL